MDRYLPRRFAASVIALVLVAASCGGDDTTTTTPTSDPATTTTVPLIPLAGPPADYEGFRAQPVACSGALPEPVTRQTFTEYTGPDVPEGTTATIVTSCGEIVIALDPAMAPETVRSFVFLAEQGYFDGTAFHRILPGFVIQGGDPTATGLGEPGYVVPDEYPAEDFTYTTGTVAMANAGPGTTGSQFFIMVGDAPLPPTFSVFGQVTSGFDALQQIVSVPLASNRFDERSTPLETVFIESVSIVTP